MPALLAPLVGLLAGMLFALVATRPAADSERLPLLAVATALYGVVVVGPITAFFLAWAPDWSFAYLIPADRVPLEATLGLPLAAAASVPAGAAALVHAAGEGPGRSAGRVMVAPALVLAVLVTALVPRWAVQATYTEFRGGFATRPVAGSSLGWALLWMGSILLGSGAWVTRTLAERAAPRSQHGPG